ncbi:unnamed protein product, partial [Hapterophycus canaliculatus]
EQRKHEEADLLYLRAIKIQEDRLGTSHPSLGTSLGNRARLLQAQVR